MPRYDYKCEGCGLEWEATNVVACRDDEVCICGIRANRMLSIPSDPVVYDYYSESLDEQITGPQQKKKVMKKLDVEEAE